MKTAKARVLLFDLECPHCNELMLEEGCSYSWPALESVSETVVCSECGETSKVPSKVPSAKLVLRGS